MFRPTAPPVGAMAVTRSLRELAAEDGAHSRYKKGRNSISPEESCGA